MDEVETGPMLSLKKRALVESFVKGMDGKRVLQRVLIANNGMAATKAILSMRQWAYMTLGDERAIEFVAMATRDDLNANAEFIRLADAYVEVPSGSNKVSCISKTHSCLILFRQQLESLVYLPEREFHARICEDGACQFTQLFYLFLRFHPSDLVII